jgi:hypothetical protein
VAITGSPDSNTDWKKLISEHLRLRVIPNDETETRHFVRRAKGYLIHIDEPYRRSTPDILQWCIPIEEGMALLLDIHEGFVGIILGQGAWSKKLFDKVFSGRRPSTSWL